jgi:enamine deaminase RidA (YjgF/YER057c/UK114 family)
MKAEQKLKELGLELQPPNKPIANYVPWVRTGNLVFLSGAGPNRPGDTRFKEYQGKLGREYSIEEGYQAARQTAYSLLCALKDAVGDLDKVKRVVKVLGMVNSVPEFGDQPKVINGCSDLLVEVFGEKGKHARSAVGMGALPNAIPVEIEMIVEVED